DESADPAENPGQLDGGVLAEHTAPSRRRPGEPEQAPDRGRLARPVRAEEPKDAAGLHRQLETVERPHRPAPPAPIALAQVLYLDDRRHRRTVRRALGRRHR